MHSYLCLKSCILLPDDGAKGPEHLAIIDDIIKLLSCVSIIHKKILVMNYFSVPQQITM